MTQHETNEQGAPEAVPAVVTGTATPAGDAGPHSKVGRRTVVRGAAWSIPVIAAAVAAPLAAASPARRFDYAYQAHNPGSRVDMSRGRAYEMVYQYVNNGPDEAPAATIQVSIPYAIHNWDQMFRLYQSGQNSSGLTYVTNFDNGGSTRVYVFTTPTTPAGTVRQGKVSFIAQGNLAQDGGQGTPAWNFLQPSGDSNTSNVPDWVGFGPFRNVA